MLALNMDDDALLALWESALGCDAWQREDLLVAAAVDGGEPPQALGERNAALLRWRRRVCGRALPLRATCPRCTAEVDFTLDSDVLCGGAAAAQPFETLRFGSHRVTFRLPIYDDLRELAGAHRNVDALADALLARCVCEIDGDEPCAPSELVDDVRAAIVARMEALDPRASLGVALVCPECAHAWDTPLDVASLLWPELCRRAEQVLLDVAALGRAYGWSESDVLRMSAARRGAYLQLAGAA